MLSFVLADPESRAALGGGPARVSLVIVRDDTGACRRCLIRTPCPDMKRGAEGTHGPLGAPPSRALQELDDHPAPLAVQGPEGT